MNYFFIGNEFQGLTIRSKEAIERARQNNYPYTVENGLYVIKSPDGYPVHIINEPQPTATDPVVKVSLSSTNLENTTNYWRDILGAKVIENSEKNAAFQFKNDYFILEFILINKPIDRAEAFGRTVYATPYAEQPIIDEKIKSINGKLHTPLVSLDTPGKATVRVIIVEAPDGHEICFVDEESFNELSEFVPESAAALDKFIDEDPFQN